MIKKKLFAAEIIGALAIIAAAVFLWNLNGLFGRPTIGIVLGAVNDSVWEKAKCIGIAYFLFGVTELLWLKPRLRRFTVAKTIGLCAALIVFIIAKVLVGGNIYLSFTVLVVSAVCGIICSYSLFESGLFLNSFFAPACLMLSMIFMMIISFSVFPPKLPLFCDPYTGLYGVIEQSFDMGAVALGK